MSSPRYELTAAQAAFLEASGRSSSNVRGTSHARLSKVRFPGSLPPVSDQSVRGTCVANAVAALVACYEGCRRRVSIQYLDEVTRLTEHAWVGRNLKLLTDGEAPEKDFEAAFPEAVSQAVLLVRANGVGSEAASAFVRSLGTKIRARVEADAGCRLKRCFEALEEYGACREELWPYSPVAMNSGMAGGDAVGSFPPGTHEDARRHRIVNGLYVLRAPNNVDEIKGILAGAHGRRPMPVCVGLELFEGRTDGCFTLPDIVRENGRAYAAQRPTGIHEVLIVGYADDSKSQGGGYFIFQNSWGRDWGDAGMGRVSYAYVACFCREAGTILQEPDDYGPGTESKDEAFIIARRRVTMICAVGICLLAAAVSIFVAVWAMRNSSMSVLPMAGEQPHNQPVSTNITHVLTNVAKVAEPPVPQVVETNAPVVAEPPRVSVPTQGVQSVAQPVDEDDDIAVEKIKDYHFLVRGVCDSTVEAMGMAYAVDGEHREFSFENMHLTDDRHSFEGEITIEGLRGHTPDAIKTIEGFLKRKKVESAVRKWSVRRLK